jgi:hypothetical protein
MRKILSVLTLFTVIGIAPSAASAADELELADRFEATARRDCAELEAANLDICRMRCVDRHRSEKHWLEACYAQCRSTILDRISDCTDREVRLWWDRRNAKKRRR